MKKSSVVDLKSQIVTSRDRPAQHQEGVGDGIASKIYVIRDVQVMLDVDLAELYGVETKALNQAVKRNIERFPADFMFRLTNEECRRSQIVTFGKNIVKANKYAPYAFTECGIAMLSGVLRSPKAIEANIEIMRAFVVMRRIMQTSAGVLQRLGAIEIKQVENDERFETIFSALDRGNLLPSGILPAGAEFDALRKVERVVEGAKRDLVVVDPYSDAVTLDVLAKKRPGVTVCLVCKNRGQPTPTEIAKFNRQYKGLTVSYSDDFHDRFILVDGIELHNLGSSINCLGRRVTTYTTRDRKEVSKFIALLSSIPMK